MPIKKLRLKEHSAAWHNQRSKTIGGSDVGAILSIPSAFTTKLKLYMEKIGEPVKKFEGNSDTMTGTELEPFIVSLYNFWNFETNSYEECLRNKQKNKRFQYTRKDKATFINSKYPWLHANTDALIIKDKRGKGILEVKNSKKMVCRSYEGMVNPAYEVQIQDYLLVTERDFCDIIIFLDGCDAIVKTYYPDEKKQEKILEETYAFNEIIQIARDVKKKYGIDHYYNKKESDFTSKQLEGVAILQSLEPDMHECDLDWVKDIMKPDPVFSTVAGTEEVLKMAQDYLVWSSEAKRAESQKKRLQALLIKELCGAHEITFNHGKITYRPDSRGRRSFYVSPKLL